MPEKLVCRQWVEILVLMCRTCRQYLWLVILGASRYQADCGSIVDVWGLEEEQNVRMQNSSPNLQAFSCLHPSSQAATT